MEEEGAVLIGVQDAFASIYKQEGIKVETLFSHIKANEGSVKNYQGTDEIEKEDFLALIAILSSLQHWAIRSLRTTRIR